MKPDTNNLANIFSSYTPETAAGIKPMKLSNGSANPFDSYRRQTIDLKTPQGLYDMAKRAGLENEARDEINKAGGESQKYMSGGFVMDAMDTLNTFSYGMVGLAKGKGFAEGVKNRESFSDEDSLGQYGWQGKVAGFIADIVVDPLTWVSPWKQLTKIPGLVKAGNSVKSKLLGEMTQIEVKGQKTFKRQGGWTPLTFLSDKLIYGSAVDKTFLEGYERKVGQNESVLGFADDLLQKMGKLKPEVFSKTLTKDLDGRIISEDLKVLQRELSTEDFEAVSGAYQMRDDLMRKLIDLEVVSKETADEHWGTYLKQSYDEYIEAKGIRGKSGIGIESKARNRELSPAMMKALGQVENPSVVWGTTLLKQIDLVKKAELQKYTADGYAMTGDMLEEFIQKGGKMEDLHGIAKDPKRYGALSGKYVSKEIWEVLKGSFEPTKELGESTVMWFKHAKVIWSPGSYVRNAFSASIQNWWKMGMGPWRADIYYDALKEFKDNGKHLNQMREMGFNERSGYIHELLSNYLTNKELMDKTLTAQLGSKSAVRKYGKHIDKMMMKAYGHIDNVAKVAGYKYGLSKGLSKEDAYRQAMAATFNYSEVTPFVQRMRKAIWGVPFITFALKAVPLVAETIAKNPGRVSVFGKARNDLFKAAGIEGEQEAEAMPDYMRDDMFVMRLPWKDENGRSMYFDLSYIIPFGAIADGTYLKDPITANPVLSLVSQLSKNETFSGNKIFNETDDISTVLADISSHILKTGLPPAATDALSDGYRQDGERVPAKIGWDKFARTNTQDLGPGERSFYQETFRMLGVGALPYNLTSKESSLAYRQKENLTKLLTENGVIKTFDTGYLPQDSEFRPENQNSYGAPLYDREVRPIGR